MRISKRLKAIASYVQRGEVVADIGCDHAQLCCYLVTQQHCDKAYACDVREGPLQQAVKTIQYYNLSSQIETILCDGLDDVREDVTTIVIAGMGFETVQAILDKNREMLINRKLIVQINKDMMKLRQWISDNRFSIKAERVVMEEDHYYEILVFTTEIDKALTSKEQRFGKRMQKDFSYYSMWKYRLGQKEQILFSMKEDNPKFDAILQEMKMIYEEFGSA